ncbi:MAG TPA: hypothetical protein VGH87_02435 [Polyangiaceae bacterium]
MKRLAVVVLFAVACGPEPKASHVEVAPLPLPDTATKVAPGKDAPRDDMRLVVHDQVGDRDGDGIADDVDNCPDDPEDRDGFQDEDGCPDPDNDQDGIPDVQDKCPNDPGPPPDGCPRKKKP